MAVATFNPSLDASMEAISLPDTALGAGTSVDLGPVYVGGTKAFQYRSLYWFDVSSLVGVFSTIDAAQLELNLLTVNAGGVAGKVYRNRRYATVTEAGVTWNKYDGTNAWTAGGANDPTNDYDAGTPGSVAYTTPASTGLWTITGLGSYITDAIASRSNIVALLLFLDVEGGTGTHQHVAQSKESGGTIPVLRVTYTPVAGDRRRVGPTLASPGVF